MRVFMKLVERYCSSHGIAVHPLADDWVVMLDRQGERRFIFGYDLGLNSSAVFQVVNDKNATFEALRACGVPSLEHRVFHNPDDRFVASTTGIWQDMIRYLAHCGGRVVCKPNNGTSGEGVHLVTSVAGLEQVTHRLFAACRSICLSPFVDDASEYRSVVLDGECLLLFEKRRPRVVGDGVATVAGLAARRRMLSAAVVEGLSAEVLASVPAPGQAVFLEWRHNLAQGGTACRLPPDDPCFRTVHDLSLAAAAALGLRFGSVDILGTAEGYQVLEVNAGVMLERFARQDDESRQLAASIIARALDRLFG